MPVMGLGTWQLLNDTTESVADAIDYGYRMIDTSGDYGTQPAVGEAIHESGVPRDEIYLVTKVEQDQDSLESTGQNLSALGLEHANLVLIHRPPTSHAGVGLWKGLMAARDNGLTADIGVSNYEIAEMEELASATGEMPVVNQIEWSPFGWSQEMKEFCDQNGIVIQAYSPLTRQRRLHDEFLEEIASENDVSTPQVLLRWALQKGVAPLPKANRVDHQRENFDVFGFELDSGAMARLDDLNEHYSALGSLPYV